MRDDIKAYYDANPVRNPINMTLTEKQYVEGQRLDRLASEQNFKHFRNLLNRQVFGNAHKRYGRQLSMFVVHEGDQNYRHHLHVVIEKPEFLDTEEFVELALHCWKKTRFGHQELHYEDPKSHSRKDGWIGDCLKKRSKDDLASSIDWENSTCFER